jgi:hypothetical protein
MFARNVHDAGPASEDRGWHMVRIESSGWVEHGFTGCGKLEC